MKPIQFFEFFDSLDRLIVRLFIFDSIIIEKCSSLLFGRFNRGLSETGSEEWNNNKNNNHHKYQHNMLKV